MLRSVAIPTALLWVALAGTAAAQVADTSRVSMPGTDRAALRNDTSFVKWPISDLSAQPSFLAVAATDSSLRWQLWSGAGEWLSRRDAFSYRLGGYGRSTGFVSGAAAMNGADWRWHGVPLRDPVSGQIDLATVPIDLSLSVLAPKAAVGPHILLPMEYYVVKPQSRFAYEQSSHDYRVLDGTLALPVSARTQFQASYQGQKDGGRFDRAAFDGRRATGDVRHLLPSGGLLGAFALYQGAEAEESLGYEMGDPSSFSFNRFRAEAVSGNSTSRRRHLLTGMTYRRPGSGATDGLSVYRDLRRRDWRSADTLGQRVTAWGLAASETWRAGRLMLRPDVELRYERPAGGGLLWTKPRWRTRTGGDAQMALHPKLTAGAHVNFEAFDGQSGLTVGGHTALKLTHGLELNLSAGHEAKPQPWSVRYATGHGFRGNLDVGGYKAERVRLALERMSGLWRPAASVEWVSDENAPMLSGDSTFVGSPKSSAVAVWAGLGFESPHWELRGSAGLQRWDGSGDVQALQRAEAFWKGPVIKSAAYLKAGAVATLSPLPYQSPLWLAEYGMWVRDENSAEVPAWFRVDVEFSARVRSLILLGRLENAFDGLGQRGYFEVLPYPMPARRFRFGVRVVFSE